MAEVTLPGEELTPEVPVVVLEKPGINSKVIGVIFDPLNTKKTTIVNTSEAFFTTDTDAWLEFTATGLTNATGTYSIVLRNRNDGSVFQHVGDMVDGKAYYKMPAQEIRHAGRWVAQMYATLENGDSTGAQFGFSVEGHLLDGADVREVVVEDFQALMVQLEAIKGQAETDLTSLKADLSLSTTEAQQLIADTNELKLVYDELLETGVLQTNINEKLTELETTYAPRLSTLEQNDVSLTAQLQQTQQELTDQFNQAVGAVTEDSEVVLARNEYPTLKERLDAEWDNVNVQLAEIENVQLPAKANKLQEAWITPTLLNGWVVANNNPVGYIKDEMGFVHLKGDIKGGAEVATVIQFPVGYRPKGGTPSYIVTRYSTTIARFIVFENGTTWVRITGGSADTTGYSLDGITFRAEG